MPGHRETGTSGPASWSTDRMRIALTALILIALAGCSSDRDVDGFLTDVDSIATTQEYESFSEEQLIETGDLACSMDETGDNYPEVPVAQTTGVPWSMVWWPAHDRLC